MNYTQNLELRRNAQIKVAEFLQQRNDDLDCNQQCPICNQPIYDLTLIYQTLNEEYIGCRSCVKENPNKNILNKTNLATFEKGEWKSTFI